MDRYRWTCIHSAWWTWTCLSRLVCSAFGLLMLRHIDGFHDILVENLSGTPTWRSSHVSPADMTSLRLRWPKEVFNTLRRRASDVESLPRDAPKRADKAFHYGGPGFCGVCPSTPCDYTNVTLVPVYYNFVLKGSLLVASVLGFACQVVFTTFAPCLEHVCAGGGGGGV